MRGCLTVLTLAAALALVGAWFGGPALAGVLVERSLAAAGYKATDSSVVVSSDPPFEILAGHADRVTIRGTSATIHDLRAARLELTLSNVDLVGRRFSRIDGQLDDVHIPAADNSSVLARSVAVRGRADAAATTVRVDEAVVADLLDEAIKRETGLSVSGVQLSEPNQIRFTAGLTIRARFDVSPDGSLVIAGTSGDPRFTVFRPDQDIRLTSVAVAGSVLVLTGTTDVSTLIR